MLHLRPVRGRRMARWRVDREAPASAQSHQPPSPRHAFPFVWYRPRVGRPSWLESSWRPGRSARRPSLRSPRPPVLAGILMIIADPSSHVDVLIVEDDEPMRRSLRLLLEGEGYHCAEAGDGREAVERARRQAPDCVLLDIVMPGLDGLTVARTLRLDPLTRAAHIHCLTGLTDPRVRQSALEASCE